MPWRSAAACKGKPTSLFFSEVAGNPATTVAKAKDICSECPVMGPCLDFALRLEVDDGVFGGTTANERRVLGREMWRAMAAAGGPET